ncbi:MAG: hypothetical protein ABI398_00405 [Devosia sp.]
MAKGYDFAIFGSGPFSALLAGLLAHDHGKQVIRIAAPVSPLRLQRAIDLALPLATRPASWSMVQRGAAETLALLTAIEAAETVAPVDVRIVADSPASVTALAHMSHIARGNGLAVRDGHFRGVHRLNGDIALTGSKVQSTDAGATLNFTKAGLAELSIAGEPTEVGQIVLADDASILDLMPEQQRPSHLTAQPMTATLTAPARRLAAPVMRYVDRGVTLAQRPDHSILALVAGERDVEARLASCLPGPFPLPRFATTHFRRLVSNDGAPLLGRLRPSRMFVAAGLGNTGAFLAPSIARLLVGIPTETERPWLVAHDPARPSRETIADFAETLI